MKHVVNFFKGATFFYVVALMWYYQNFSRAMYLYLALHGSYGMIWIFKDVVFGDKSFDQYAKIGSVVCHILFLSMYWMMAWFLASGQGTH